MTNNRIKNLIRKSMLNNRECIDIGRIRFEGVNRKEDGSIEINRITLTLNSTCGVLIDEIKSALYDFGMEYKIDFVGIYLDI